MKEYLKMSDVFQDSVNHDHDGNFITIGRSRVADFGFHAALCSYAAHAINSHDGLVEEIELLRKRVSELEGFTYHFCDNSYNVDLGGGDCTATTCEAKEMAHKLDNRA